jgi:hypothetical protein
MIFKCKRNFLVCCSDTARIKRQQGYKRREIDLQPESDDEDGDDEGNSGSANWEGAGASSELRDSEVSRVSETLIHNTTMNTTLQKEESDLFKDDDIGDSNNNTPLLDESIKRKKTVGFKVSH